MPHGEGSTGSDPMERFRPEVDKAGAAAREGIEGLKKDILETQDKELREFLASVEKDIERFELIREDICTTEHGPDWRNVIAGQGENTPVEA